LTAVFFGALAARAASAACKASRAHGAIRAGDSIASAGADQYDSETSSRFFAL